MPSEVAVILAAAEKASMGLRTGLVALDNEALMFETGKDFFLLCPLMI
jgi:hypothetical protein